MSTNAQNEWVTRVLGHRFANGGGRDTEALRAAIAGFRAASEQVDEQIASLQQALRGSDDEELQEIGEYGLNAVTGNFRVPLLAALFGAERGDERAIAKLSGAIDGFRQHLESDEKVEACDENPLGVAVSLRATLLPALDQLARSVAQ